MQICSNCKKHFDESKQVISLRLFSDLSFNDIFYFCSGVCHTIWMLEDCHDMAKTYRVIDSSWFPVIRQLRDQLVKKLEEKIGE